MNNPDKLLRYTLTFKMPSGETHETKELDENLFKAMLDYILQWFSPARDASASPYMLVPRDDIKDEFNPLYINLNLIESYEYQIFKLQRKNGKYQAVKINEEAGKNKDNIKNVDEGEAPLTPNVEVGNGIPRIEKLAGASELPKQTSTDGAVANQISHGESPGSSFPKVVSVETPEGGTPNGEIL